MNDLNIGGRLQRAACDGMF